MIDVIDDPRLVRIDNRERIGLTRSLNRAIRTSTGQFLARQDPDDISLPDRFEKQLSVLENNPAVGLVGCWSRWLDSNDRPVQHDPPPVDNATLQQQIMSSSPIEHGTFFFRREVLRNIGQGYNPDWLIAQDFDILLRISDRWNLLNVAEELTIHRPYQTFERDEQGERQKYVTRSQREAIQRRLAFGWGRVLDRRDVPEWVSLARRKSIARRFSWWAKGARPISRVTSLRLWLIAVLLYPFLPEILSEFTGR